MMREIRKTRSVCPVCLRKLKASLWQDESGAVELKKTCPLHGEFTVPVWRGKLDFEEWTRGAEPLGEAGKNCPDCPGICPEHGSESCCVLLEVTKRCNLRCRFCFADAGSGEDAPTAAVKAEISDIVRQRGAVMLHLSGGEPTVRDDLPELIAHAKRAGVGYVQLNTNGLRLAEDANYALSLKEAGLDIVFLQFDGMEESIYRFLRGRELFETKKKAIENCAAARLGVTLVPTIVAGVNDGNIGEIVRFAAERVPAVRGVHFQPVSYFGRCPGLPERRYTLDELMADIATQCGISAESFVPSRCDHPLCGFHASYLVRPDGSFQPLTAFKRSRPGRGSAGENREYVAKRWIRGDGEGESAGAFSDSMDFDTFLFQMKNRSLSLSAMAFQDAGNLNIERLHRCSLHVYEKGVVRPFCTNYLSKME